MTTVHKKRPPAVTFISADADRGKGEQVAAIRAESDWEGTPEDRPDILSVRLMIRARDRFIVTETKRLEPEHGETYYVQIRVPGMECLDCYFTDEEMSAFRRWMVGGTVDSFALVEFA